MKKAKLGFILMILGLVITVDSYAMDGLGRPPISPKISSTSTNNKQKEKKVFFFLNYDEKFDDENPDNFIDYYKKLECLANKYLRLKTKVCNLRPESSFDTIEYIINNLSLKAVVMKDNLEEFNEDLMDEIEVVFYTEKTKSQYDEQWRRFKLWEVNNRYASESNSSNASKRTTPSVSGKTTPIKEFDLN